MKTTNLLTLPDNRRLAYAEYGNPNGHPFLYFHGGGASRLEPLLLGDEVFSRLGLRVIAPDRPGIGQSDFQPKRGFSDWVKDVEVLADGLGLDKFSVLGISAGGGYAAVCAAKIPERLHTVVIASGAWQMDTINNLPQFNRWSWILLKQFPLLHRGSLKVMRRSLNSSPERLLASFKPQLPLSDYAVLESPGRMEVYRQAAIEGLRSGTRGAAWDIQLYLRKWDFSLDEIQMPLTLFYGEEDRNVPLDLVRRVAVSLPQTKLMIFPNEGHISVVVNQIEAIAKVLVGE
ncbi:MAG: alpha/beta hydrolase [Myxacorys chilensis ATA2-1-KO14]|jgi:pimeloyl-ACP methyl ester carboxylesterase|nr:alpha/beta hydrolase [Myxacorys chilensis ATA2-1-KO14]